MQTGLIDPQWLGMAVNVAAMAAAIILLATYRILCKSENNRREAMTTGHEDHAFEVCLSFWFAGLAMI